MTAPTTFASTWALRVATAILATATAAALPTPAAASTDGTHPDEVRTSPTHLSRFLPSALSRSFTQQPLAPANATQATAHAGVTVASATPPRQVRSASTAETTSPPPDRAEATSPPSDRVNAIVDRIQQTYETVDDFQASFTQDYTSASLGETRTSEGRVFFRKPGMMRWDYRTPTQRFLISDGQSLWVYEPEFAQYYEQSLQDSQLPTALRFLMGEGNLRDDFEISLRSEEANRAVLDLVPRRSEGQIRRLRFTVDLDSGTVIETVIVDPLGNTNRLRFRDVRQNAGLPAANFSFSPPAGTTRISAPD